MKILKELIEKLKAYLLRSQSAALSLTPPFKAKVFWRTNITDSIEYLLYKYKLKWVAAIVQQGMRDQLRHKRQMPSQIQSFNKSWMPFSGSMTKIIAVNWTSKRPLTFYKIHLRAQGMFLLAEKSKSSLKLLILTKTERYRRHSSKISIKKFLEPKGTKSDQTLSLNK